MANRYDKGDVVRLSGAFTSGGSAIDPTTVAIKVKDPSGVIQTFTYGTEASVVKDSTGNYHYDLTTSMVGQYWYRWESTGTGAAAGETYLAVKSAF